MSGHNYLYLPHPALVVIVVTWIHYATLKFKISLVASL